MRYKSSQEFISDDKKRIVLIGLSGVGKTTTSRTLASAGWQQYSVDWYIGTKFLNKEIDELFANNENNKKFMDKAKKKRAVDTVTGKPKVSENNLYAISAYVGMVGHPDKSGLPEAEFRYRLRTHAEAELAATKEMIAQAKMSRGNFVADASGSLCEVIEPSDDNDLVMKALEEIATVVYIISHQSHDKLLIEQQAADPKPLYYRQEFLDEHLPEFVSEKKLAHIDEAEPGEVGSWLLPRLINERRTRYDKIIKRLGYKVSMDDMRSVKTEQDFINLVAKAIDASTDIIS